MYRRTRRDFSVKPPPRHDAFAGGLLAVAAAARAAGRQLGHVIKKRVDTRDTTSAAPQVIEVLREQGFDPEQPDDSTVVLWNCPFHLLAQRHTELICGMNYCMIDAALGELGEVGLEARLEPSPDTCCVRLHRRLTGVAAHVRLVRGRT